MLGWEGRSGHLRVALSRVREDGSWLSPTCLHSVVSFPSGVPTVGRNLIAEAIPSAAGCQLVGTLGGSGAEEARAVLFLLSSLSWLPCCPCPVFFLQDHIPVPYQPDSSSNPSSTTSSTPSSPAPPLPPSATPPSPLHPSPQCTRQQKTFNLPGTPVLGEARRCWVHARSLGGTLAGMWSESYMQDTCHT